MLKYKNDVSKMSENELRLFRYRALCKVRALHESIVVNLGKIHGAVLTGLGNESAPMGVLLGMLESMSAEDFLFSPKGGKQRSQTALAVATDLVIESEHDHSYMILCNHLQRKGVEDGNVHWGCFKHGIWPFFTSDMMRHYGPLAGGAWEVRRYLPNPVGLYIFGEGAASQGAAHEVNNWIAAQNYVRTPEQMAMYKDMPVSDRAKETGVLRPVPFIGAMEINKWAIYTNSIDEHGGRAERDEIFGNSKFALWAESYGFRSVDVNGDDFEAVILEIKEAVRCSQLETPIPTLLLMHMDERRTGHNEHQITRTDEARKNREWGKAHILNPGDTAYVVEERMAELWETEPLKIYGQYLADLSVATESELKAILKEEQDLMDERFERALAEPPATFEDSVSKRKGKYFMFKFHKWELPHKERPLGQMLEGGTTTDRALLNVIAEFMEEDEGTTYQGEDVGSGGVLIRTRDLQKKFGPERVFDSPISEEAIAGTSAGASIARWILRQYEIVKTKGTKIFEMQFMPFDGDALAFMRCIAPNAYQKDMPTAFIDIEHYGVVHGGGSGHNHSDCRELEYVNMPGLAVVCPSDAWDLVGLMRAARECEWPVVFMSPIWSYNEQECAAKIPKEKYLIPIGKAAVKRPGKDITVITYGTCVRAALREAEFLAKKGIDVEVVDLRTLAPLDVETVAESVKKTGRAVIMTEASRQTGEWLRGELFSNHTIQDAIRRTRKPMQNVGESLEEFEERVDEWVEKTHSELFTDSAVRESLDTSNRLPDIPIISRDITPIASAKDIEWQDLPFEEYFEKHGEEKPRKRLRAMRLSLIARELMRY